MFLAHQNTAALNDLDFEEPMAKYEVSRSYSYDLILDQFDPPKAKTSEQNLLAAVLEKACHDLTSKETCQRLQEPSFKVLNGELVSYQKRRHKDDPPGMTVAQEAEEWFLDDGMEPFSFLWLCQHLDLDPLMIRNHMLELKKSLA